MVIRRISLLALSLFALAPAGIAGIFEDSNHEGVFSSSFEAFYAGPQWFRNALSNPAATRGSILNHSIYDASGDRLIEAAYVGTLRNQYNADADNFSSPFNCTSAAGTSFTALAPTSNTAYYYSGAGIANWSDDASWGPTTGIPNAPGDSALDVQVVDGHVVQDLVGGVTVGIIDNVPTTPGNSGVAVSWTITTLQPIILESGSAAPAQINNSQAVGTSSLTIDTTSANGLRLNSNLSVTNANPGGLITISAPISDVTNTPGHSVSVAGPGTTVFSGNNTYGGGTTIDSGGTLLVNNTAGSGTGSGTVTVGNTGTLGGNGFIIGGDVTVNSGGLMTPGTNGTVGNLTMTVPNANFLSGSIFHIDLGGTTADLLTLSGMFNVTNGATIDFNELSPLSANSYTLATYGSWNTVEFLAPNVPSGYQLIYGTDSLVLSEVPEPGTWIGAALALAAIGFTQRRKLRALLVSRA